MAGFSWLWRKADGQVKPVLAHSGAEPGPERLFQKAFWRSLMMKTAHDSFAGSSYFRHRR